MSWDYLMIWACVAMALFAESVVNLLMGVH